MARLQYVRCIGSQDPAHGQRWLDEWSQVLFEVTSDDTRNIALRYSPGAVPRDQAQFNAGIQRSMRELLNATRSIDYPTAVESVSLPCSITAHAHVLTSSRRHSGLLFFVALQFLEIGPHHHSVLEHLQAEESARFAGPPPPPTTVDIGNVPLVADLLIPADVSRSYFAEGMTQQAAVSTYVGDHLRRCGTDLQAATLDVSDIPLAFIPGTNVLAL